MAETAIYYNNISERETYISQLHESRGVTDYSTLIPLEYCSIPGACRPYGRTIAKAYSPKNSSSVNHCLNQKT